MSTSRREFIAGAAVAAAMLPKAARAQRKPKPGNVLPIVVATWDYGAHLCAAAQKVFAKHGDLLDALEAGVNVVEDDPAVTSVGFNGLPNEDGVVQLDAAIMDGRTHRAGCVGALERIKNPISVARKVMERTDHVMLVGEGALKFARRMGFTEQDLMTPAARVEWAKRPRKSHWAEDAHDTVCGIGMDASGNIAVAVSTSGLVNKLSGRLGDSPIIGAGSYVDNDVGAAAATGVGELAICNAASFAIVERMRAGVEPSRACEEILERVLKKRPEIRNNEMMQLAFIALNKAGDPGAAALRKQKKLFRYAVSRGTKAPPAMVEVKPLLP
jgi:N4-(beta-N-acetylglucosaminyl)-L-asparaginase